MSLSTVLQLLPTLTPAELQKVRSSIGALLSISGTSASEPVNDDETWVLSCVCQVCRAHSGEQAHETLLRKSSSIAPFRRDLPALLTYLEQGVGHQRAQKQTLLLIGLGLLIDSMNVIGIPVTSRMMLRQLPRIPSVVNRAFPGYWQQGMLPWVIKTHNQGNSHVRQESRSRSVPERRRLASGP